MMGSK